METTQASFDYYELENPMGERRKDARRLDFDRKLKVEFHGTKATSDAGLLAYRELDEVLGLTTWIDSALTDNRTGKNTQHSCLAMLRQSIYRRLAANHDPAFFTVFPLRTRQERDRFDLLRQAYVGARYHDDYKKQARNSNTWQDA